MINVLYEFVAVHAYICDKCWSGLSGYTISTVPVSHLIIQMCFFSICESILPLASHYKFLAFGAKFILQCLYPLKLVFLNLDDDVPLNLKYTYHQLTATENLMFDINKTPVSFHRTTYLKLILPTD
jgi:hypothetical protein